MCTYWQLGNFQFPTHKPSREAGWASWEMTWFLCLSGLWSVVLSCSSLSTTTARENTWKHQTVQILFVSCCSKSYFLVLINYLMPDSWCLCTWWLCLYIFMISWFTLSFYAAYIPPWVHSSVASRLRTQWPQGLRRSCNPTFFPFQFQKIVCQPYFGGWSFHSFG